jgi:hypothetical protein
VGKSTAENEATQLHACSVFDFNFQFLQFNATTMKKQKKLTPKEMEEVLAILTIGCSRAAAARSIMRSPSSLRYAIAKDPEFANGIYTSFSHLGNEMPQE